MERNELAHRIRLRGRRLPRRLPRMRQPDMIRVRYFAAIRRTVLADLRRAVTRKLIPRLPVFASAGTIARGVETTKTDAAADAELDNILDEIADDLADKWSRAEFRKLVQPFAADLAKFNAEQTNRLLREIAGVDVVGSEPWLADMIAAFTRENVALIKGIIPETLNRIEKNVTQEIADGARWESMAEQLERDLGFSESRAKLVARDQSGKFYGDLNRVRQTDLGFNRYIWRTVRDNRVRDQHEDRDGRFFDWDDPPPGGPAAGGHPGQAIMCRCFAEPDLRALLEAEGIDPSGLDLP